MAKLVYANGGLLYRPDGSFVQDDAGAPCCCGGGGPNCSCINGPGCIPSGTVQFHGIQANRNVPVITYPVMPAVVDCCCRSPLGMRRTYYRFTEAYNPATGVLICRTIAEGSGVNGALAVRYRKWEDTGGGLTQTFEGNTNLFITDCFPQQINAVLGPPSCTPGIGLGTLGVEGYERRSCSLHEKEVLEYFPSPFNGELNRLGFVERIRHSLTVDRAGCIDPSCRACCLPDGLCIVTDAASCLARGGTVRTGTDCGAARCPQPNPDDPGGCCLPDGSCRDTTRRKCRDINGAFHAGQACGTFVCPSPPVRACCLGPGQCFPRTQANCPGVWYPNNQCGDPGVCVEQTGSCCTQSGAGATCAVTTLAGCGGGTWTAGGTCANGDATCLGACCRPNPGCASGFLCSDGVGQAFCNGSGGIWHGGGSLCANVADPGGCCNSGSLRGPIIIATGAQTMAVTSGCSQCGKDEVRL